MLKWPEKAAADKINAASKAQYDTDQAAYEKGLAKYQADKKPMMQHWKSTMLKN